MEPPVNSPVNLIQEKLSKLNNPKKYLHPAAKDVFLIGDLVVIEEINDPSLLSCAEISAASYLIRGRPRQRIGSVSELVYRKIEKAPASNNLPS